jgi:AICAR transformylase/IMP cyclohydrolase PurH
VRALISVYDKAGLEELAHGLTELGVELVASGGTAVYLEELGLEVRHVEELTEVPELLGGRVKTLHPRIHAGILARRDRADDLAALAEHEIPPFDLVCVNLYPFERAREIEMIDVGGPALLRAAAKNWSHVAAVCRPPRPRTTRRSRPGLPATSASRRRSRSRSRRWPTSPTARTRISGLRTTRRSAPTAICSPASSSCTAAHSRSSTSTTSTQDA